MQTEIEAKFLDVDHDLVRSKLKTLGAELEHPMRLMRRVMLDHGDKRYQKSNQAERLRIRDEGDKITITYKKSNESNYPYELETTVGSFDDAVKLFEAIGFAVYSYQESRRETWRYKEVEIVLDEWPWLNPYIEVEGHSEEAIKAVAGRLDFIWSDARYGSVDTAYRHQYPGMTQKESIGHISEVRFDRSLPDWLNNKKH
jgi:adenylate cyclase class 2